MSQEILIALIVGLTPVVVKLVDLGFAKFGAQIPSVAKPLLAAALGALVTYLSGVHNGSPVVMAAISLATIGVREIIDQLTKTAQKMGLFKG